MFKMIYLLITSCLVITALTNRNMSNFRKATSLDSLALTINFLQSFDEGPFFIGAESR